MLGYGRLVATPCWLKEKGDTAPLAWDVKTDMSVDKSHRIGHTMDYWY